ncbi:tetratricopeptide repeat protein [Thalassospira sp. TSL5-1]|uniref:tetratricopeptide repeat protein n=1 Tax=Thalassospira sp. TSL5-1 TaxID=1544451 RepID=UPI0009392F65|nr:tetratricopeptide repeat protein [Thalassospira sp. TSL5-1]OKH86258.1 hypothetical protein LF95_23540 [Thalassospira sp. TSL5-1]
MTGAVIAAGIMMVPSKRELANIYFRDKDFVKARNFYEEEYDDGDRNIDVYGALSRIYLQNGEIDRAIKLFEELHQREPDSIRILTDLGTLYQYAQRPNDYTRTLEERRKLDPTEAVLRDLSNIYNFNGRYRDQIDVLHELVERGWSTTNDLISIVYLYASIGQPQKSLDFIEDLLSRPNGFTPTLAELKLRLLFDARDLKQASEFSAEWMRKEPTFATAQKIANLYQARTKNPQLVAVLETLRGVVPQKIEPLEVIYAAALLDAGRIAEAQNVLASYIATNSLSDNGWGVAIRIAIGSGNLTEAADYTTRHPDASTPDLMSYGLEVALNQNDLKSAAIFAAQIPQDVRENAPVLWARYAVLRKDQPEIAKWIKLALAQKKMAFAKRYDLAMLLNQLGRTADLLPVLDDLARTSPANGDLFSIASLYVALGQAQHGLNELQPVLENNPVLRNQAALALLNAATGRGDLAQKWLASANDSALDADLLSTLYDAATQGKAYGFAELLAREIAHRQPGMENRLLVLQAIWQQKDMARLDAALDDLPPAKSLSPADATQLAQFLTDINRPARAYDIAGAFKADFATHTDLADLWVSAALATGHMKELYDTVSALGLPSGKLSLATFTAYIEAASTLNKTALLHDDILARYGELPDWLRSLLIDRALDQGETVFAQSYLQREQNLRDGEFWFYLASARAAVASNKFDQARTMLQKSLQHLDNSTPQALLQMTRLWQVIGAPAPQDTPDVTPAIAAANNTNANTSTTGTSKPAASGLDAPATAAINQILDALQKAKTLDDASLPETALLFRNMGRRADGLAFINQVASEPRSYNGKLADAILAITANTPQKTRDWIANYDWQVDQIGDLATLQSLANQYGDVTTERLTAQKQFDLVPNNPAFRFALADTQLRSGNYSAALALAKNLPLSNPDYRNLYTEALRQSVNAGGPGRKELVTLLAQDLHDSTEPRQTQLLYDLIGLAAYDTVLPQLAARAGTSNEWSNYYVDALSALGRQKEALAYLAKRADTPGLANSERQEIAFRLLAAGEKKPATQIFQKVAAETGPNSDAAKNLLYLWGPRLTEPQADWVAERIAKSSGKTRLAWLEIAGNTFAPARADKILSQYADQYETNPEFVSQLITTYQQNGNRAAMLGLIDSQRKLALNDPKRLKILLAAAQANNFPSQAQQIAERLTVIDPSAPEPFRIMGQFAFSREQFDKARAYLERYLALAASGDFETYYQLGEANDRLGREKAARQNYRTSLDLLKTRQNPTFYMRHLEGLLLQRLQRYDEAIAIFEQLLRENPGDDGVIADIAETRLLQQSPQRALQQVRQK